MSYDLMVFDAQASPRDRAGFLDWYGKQVEWGEGHSYDNDALTTPALKAWFSEMRESFPAMNGPYATGDVDNPRVTDYSIGRHLIYAAFRWSEAENASGEMFRLAEKHQVGFFDVSAEDGGVWMPEPSGGYACVHGGGHPVG